MAMQILCAFYFVVSAYKHLLQSVPVPANSSIQTSVKVVSRVVFYSHCVK